MTEFGYIWVGPLEHNFEYQRDLLLRGGATRLFHDISSNTATPARPSLTTALDQIKGEDTLVIWRLDRLASTVPQVLSLLKLLGDKGVGVRSIAEKLDTTRPGGTALLGVVDALINLEKTLARERTMVGIYAAKSRGRVGGRPRALSATNVERVVLLRDQGASVREIAQQLGTSRATVYRALEEQQSGPGAQDPDPSPAKEGIEIRFSTPHLELRDSSATGKA